jgi:hypothetical protein
MSGDAMDGPDADPRGFWFPADPFLIAGWLTGWLEPKWPFFPLIVPFLAILAEGFPIVEVRSAVADIMRGISVPPRDTDQFVQQIHQLFVYSIHCKDLKKNPLRRYRK